MPLVPWLDRLSTAIEQVAGLFLGVITVLVFASARPLCPRVADPGRVRHRAPDARRRHALGLRQRRLPGAHIKVDLVAELLPARARRVLDVLASLVLLLFTVLLAAMLLGRVESAYASNGPPSICAPVWPWLAAIWLGARLGLYHRQPPRAHAARLRAEREVHGRGGAGMSTADLVAVAGFAAMFLMLVRVPIGVAMALTGVGGFAAIAGWGPAQPARRRRCARRPTTTSA